MKTLQRYNDKMRIRPFFIADEHYYHRPILFFQERPYLTTFLMLEDYIGQHNSTVEKHDHVYHIGDFSFGSQEQTWEIINTLKGKHFFIEGSHDDTVIRMGRNPKYASRINIVGRIEMIRWNDVPVVMSHYVLEIWPKKHCGAIHLHGHSHGKSRLAYNRLDVGVDVIGPTPQNAIEIFNMMNVHNELIREQENDRKKSSV